MSYVVSFSTIALIKILLYPTRISDQPVRISSITHVLTKSPPELNVNFGLSVTSGNMDKDVFDDIIIGSPSADSGAIDNCP